MRRTLIALGAAQSNEFGAGPAGSRRAVAGWGAPYIDPVLRGWWPACCEAMARDYRHWLMVMNTAVASTSLTEQWVGRLRAWVSGQVYGVGGYALHGGQVWRKTSAGIQASTTAPAAGTGADGVSWVLARAATAADQSGTVYPHTDALYDPNGYIATALAAITGKPGYDRTGLYMSIGQTDHTVSSTRQQYAAAAVNLAEHVTGLGHHFWIGMTCYMGGDASRETTMQNVLLPGRLDALAALAGHKRVHAGCDLRTELGILGVGVANSVVGLQADALHLTTAAYEAAGPLVARSIAVSD